MQDSICRVKPLLGMIFQAGTFGSQGVFVRDACHQEVTKANQVVDPRTMNSEYI